ncbi:MAG: lamin tail domain-containing protein [Saprospiraceae bacterium]|nr:lamin tail domain-containing protein [Candidatus Vicinibacter affinis]
MAFIVIILKDIQDISGNQVRENQYINFNSQKHYPAKSGEILINEFMADPSPTAGLPETEFIELLNISGKHLQLKNLSIADGSSISENFPDFIIEPDSFILIYHKADSSLFKNYGKGIGLSKFPTINNSEEILRLFDASGDLIHQVNFSDSWYQNSFKKNGGYSLELKKNHYNFAKVQKFGGPLNIS